jgi:hypothetical protein
MLSVQALYHRAIVGENDTAACHSRVRLQYAPGPGDPSIVVQVICRLKGVSGEMQDDGIGAFQDSLGHHLASVDFSKQTPHDLSKPGPDTKAFHLFDQSGGNMACSMGGAFQVGLRFRDLKVGGLHPQLDLRLQKTVLEPPENGQGTVRQRFYFNNLVSDKIKNHPFYSFSNPVRSVMKMVLFQCSPLVNSKISQGLPVCRKTMGQACVIDAPPSFSYDHQMALGRPRFSNTRKWREMEGNIKKTANLIEHIAHVLYAKSRRTPLFPEGISRSVTASSVLFPLSLQCHGAGPLSEPCIIFNKRSRKVKQPGDLCFPGGSIAPHLDVWLSRLLIMPFFPLARWSYWPRWRTWRPRQARRLALLLATGLRESFEEMRLNPFGVRFLGPLPSQSLVMFERVIYPMVAWIPCQQRFFPNWEVEKIIRIPMRNLLNPDSYARYRLGFKLGKENPKNGETEDFPCFLHEDHDGKEVLWGATYRVVTVFLDLVYGFRPPGAGSLPVVHGTLDMQYYEGAGK